MADSEQKARRKLEEAEKKCRGGGGFLGKLFGGSGADDAADLFIQHKSSNDEPGPSTTNASDTEESNTSGDEIEPVECDLCFREFPNIVEFESHYAEAHTHQCAACAKMFISERALEVHSDETHCPFHTLNVERDPSGNHFKCYDERCVSAFENAVERDEHCREVHNISDVEVTIEKRKLARRMNELQVTLGKMKVSGKRAAVPRSVKFGEQEKTFVGVRSTKVADRTKKTHADVSAQ